MAKRIPPIVREYMRQLGAAGGKKSGKALTAEQRSARARKAATVRWKKHPAR
jgi:hypothetical protein